MKEVIWDRDFLSGDLVKKTVLMHFTRDELREYAASIEVKQGRNKEDTVKNLLDSGKVTLGVTLLA